MTQMIPTRFERITHEPDPDTLVRMVTAMHSWADLEKSMKEHGYIPTLICYPNDDEWTKDAKKALVKLIREKGYQAWEGSKGPKVSRVRG